MKDSKQNEILDFIERRFKKDSDWVNGNCYYFARILKDRFPEGTIYYNVVYGHFVFGYDGEFYDWLGVTNISGCFVQWEKFDKYDALQKERIIRDCIL